MQVGGGCGVKNLIVECMAGACKLCVVVFGVLGGEESGFALLERHVRVLPIQVAALNVEHHAIA